MKIKGIGKETTEELRRNIPSYISPWQYKDSDINIINIESVLSDVITNWNQEMRFRQGFSINEDNSLNLPTFFMQINGIYNDKNKYRNFISELETKDTIRIKETKNMFKFKSMIDMDKLFVDGILNTNYIKKIGCNFSSINESMEKMLYKKLQEFYKKYPNIDSTIYSKIVYLNEKYLNLLHNFDYCFSNPKILVENMDDDNFTDSDKYVLIFLYSLGFDILIFSPKGLKFLSDYKINSITLDCYLSNMQDIYDYRDDKDIQKEEKEKKKKEKDKEKNLKKMRRKEKIKTFFWISFILILILSAIGGIGYAIYYDMTLSDDARMQKYTDNLSFKTPTDVVYVNIDDINVYKYPSDDSEIYSKDTISLDKNEKLERLAFTDNWSKFKTSNGTNYYLKNSEIRESYYKDEVLTFSKNITTTKEINVYQFMNIDDEILFTYQKDDNIKIIGYTDDFYQVEKDGDIGFIEKDCIEENIDNLELEEDNDSIGIIGIILIVILIIFLAICFIVFICAY